MRLYRALLHLYPASFRREYGGEMLEVFATRRREAEGWFGATALWIAAIGEVVGNAGLVHWDILRQDLRYIRRALARTPGFAITAVLVTALGVGANAAAFSVTDFVLIRPLPFPEPERLVKLWQRPPGYDEMELSPANYRDWKAMSGSFEAMGAFHTFAANLVGLDEPERIGGTRVTPELLSILGIRPVLGRGFTDDDARPDAPLTAMLSHGFWRARFAADPGVIGRVIDLDGAAYQVIGVLPPEATFPTPESRLWVPFQFTEQAFEDRGDNYLEVVARLAPGATIERARADLGVVAARLAELYPAANRNTGAAIVSLRDQFSDRSRLLLIALTGASLCILIVACANLGGLLLARGIARERELAVRTALGAGRERLVRQLATESLVLAGAGAVVGVVTASAALPLLARLVPDTLPLPGAPAIDARVLGFAVGLTVVTCLLFAVLPLQRAGRGRDLTALRDGTRAGGGRREGLRATLVAVEVAASVVLLVTAGLLMRAIQKVQEVKPGFRVEGVLTLRTALPSPRYDVVADRQRFYRTVLSEVSSLPGVSAAAYVSAVPLVWGGGIWPVVVRGEDEIRAGSNTASMRYVTPGYFAALDIPVRAGRDVGEQDRQDAPFVAVVSESFAERYWPGEEPLGKPFRMAFNERVVVGVVADIMVRGLERSSEPQVYFPAQQVGDGSLVYYWPKDLVIRAEHPAALLPAVRDVIRAADPEQAVSDERTMAAILDEQTGARAVQLRVLAALAAIALVLAAVGIHGLVSFTVSQRAREIGLRMALGAQASSVLGRVVGRALLLTLAGIVPGVVVAYLAARGMRAALFGIPPADWPTFAVVVTLCVGMAIAGCLGPAIRAVRLDPVRVLRAD